jgi:hypothetical protein
MASKLLHMSHGPFKHISSQLVSFSIGIISIETLTGTEASKLKEGQALLVE